MEAVHFHPMDDNGNVRCLNGSAHIRATRDIEAVTCTKCKDKNHAKNFWAEKEAEKRMGKVEWARQKKLLNI